MVRNEKLMSHRFNLFNFVYMVRKFKKATSKGIGTKPLITVDPSLPSFEGHPYFEEKAEAARKLLKKVGLPKELTKRIHPR